MAKVIFDFNNQKIIVQCQISDIFNEICKKFSAKINIPHENWIFLYAGKKINMELSFEKQANSIDIDKKEMNVLVNELNQINDDNSGQKNNEDKEFEKEIETMKDKLNSILDKYLGERKYVKDKIDNWRDAIMKESEFMFIQYKDKYKFFCN